MKIETDVLIIGGGFGGVSVAQKLSANGVDVTLIDSKNYFEVTFAMLRNVTDPRALGNNPRKLYAEFIKGNFIQGKIETMDEKSAILKDGKKIIFNKAVIATGSRYPSLPLAKSISSLDYLERKDEMLREQEKLSSARSILVIGGGVVGVEFAGEISSAFPDKNITLAHSKGVLLENLKPKAQRKALEQLNARGIEVKFNRRFVKNGEKYKCSKTGEIIEVDLAYVCVGMVPNTEFLKEHLSDTLDKKGLVKVDSSMKVEGFDNLFALGDSSNLDVSKHGYLASLQGAILADSLMRERKGGKIKPYKTPTFAVITVTGQDSGIAQMPFGTTTLNLFVNLKQKDMGITSMYKLLGTTPDTLDD